MPLAPVGQSFRSVRMDLRSANSHKTPIGTRGYQPRLARHPENAAGSRVSLEHRRFKGAAELPLGVFGRRTALLLTIWASAAPGRSPAAEPKLCPTVPDPKFKWH